MSIGNLWELIVSIWLQMASFFVESSIEVQLDEVRVLSDFWGLSHGHVEWVVLAQEAEVPGVLGLLVDHLINGVDLCVDELAKFWQEALDDLVDGAIEPVGNCV